MSHGGDLFALGEGVASQPSFDTALRGYDKRQVDRYVESVENDLATVSAEREQAFGQLHALAGQVQQLQDQLVEAARKAVPSRVSFRHLGSRVEQILSLAEDQAESIVTQAEQSILDRRAEADRILADAQHRALTAAHDFDLALSARRAQEHQADEQRKLDLEQETQRIRAEARDLLTHAQQEAQAIRTAAAQEIAARRVQADRDITQARVESEQRLAIASQEIAVAAEQAETQRGAVAQTRAELTAVESQLAAAQAQTAKAHDQLGTLRQQVAAEIEQLQRLRLAASQPEPEPVAKSGAAEPEPVAEPGAAGAAGPVAESGAAGSGPTDHEVTVQLSAAAPQDEANETVRLDIGSRDGAQRYTTPRGDTAPMPHDDPDKTTELRAG